MKDDFIASKEERYALIVDKLLSMYYDGHLKTGDKMPSENQLAQQLGISRAHIREVYSALNIFGVVESRRGEGTYFTTSDNDILLKILFLNLFNHAVDVYEIMELRKALEVSIAEKAAVNRTEKHAAELIRCLNEMEHCNDGAKLSELDNELHSIIADACGNYPLMKLSGVVSGLVIKSIQKHWNYIVFDKSRKTKQTTFEQHKELVDSIVNKKPYIAKVVAQEHLEFVTGSLSRYEEEYRSSTQNEPQ